MEGIKRSEVYFGCRGYEYSNVNFAQKHAYKYYTCGTGPRNHVYHADLNRNSVCRVEDLLDDRATGEEEMGAP